METVSGDLLQLALDGVFDVIIHGCNCHCTMGAGIAKQIRVRFPEAYEADLQTPRGAREKLGSFSTADIVRGEARFVVVNAYTQFNWSGAGIKADYEAIRAVMGGIRKSYGGKRVGYPMIGAGLAGGDWSVISAIIDEELAGERHTLVVYAPAG